MKKWMTKRALPLLLSIVMAMSMNGAPVYAFGVAAGEDGFHAEPGAGLCEHHPEHTAECGHIAPTEGEPCTHEHTDVCYAKETLCVHVHDGSCYSDGALPAEGEDKDADACAHACTEDSGCVTAGLDCRHAHDEECGYVPEDPGAPCAYACRICPIEGLIDALPDEVTADNADEAGERLEEILALYQDLSEEEQGLIDLSLCYELQAALDASSAPALLADSVPYQEASWDEDSKTVVYKDKTADSCNAVESSGGVVRWYDGWYVVNNNVAITTRILVNGNANLILADGCTLTASAGISVSGDGNTLTIYGQKNNTGTLKAIAIDRYAAGIGGGNKGNSGNITIHGGTVEATGSTTGAGIGGGSGGTGSNITIYGGTVSATGDSGAGIGGGSGGAGSNITIYGGTVSATSGGSGAGIGGGSGGGAGSAITISGGMVSATGGSSGAGIGGGGNGGAGSDITISGGMVEATSNSGAGIGGGSGGGAGSNITISGGTVSATGGVSGSSGAGIGGGSGGAGSNITISGGTVSATGGSSGAGIGGGGNGGAGSDITISGGMVEATSQRGAGIGGGSGGSSAGFYTGTDGSAAIIASSIQDASDQSNWSGVIINGNGGQAYGDFTLTEELVIPAGKTLTVPAGVTLTVAEGATLTVEEGATLKVEEGAILKNNGTINGKPSGAGSFLMDPREDLIMVPDGLHYTGQDLSETIKDRVNENISDSVEIGGVTYTVDKDGWVLNVTKMSDLEYTVTYAKGDHKIEKAVEIKKSGTQFTGDGEVTTYKDDRKTDTFAYEDAITVRATPTATGAAPVMAADSFAEPTAGRMAVYYKNAQVSAPAAAAFDGSYTMTVNPADLGLTAEELNREITLTVKFIGTLAMDNAESAAAVTVTADAKVEKGATSYVGQLKDAFVNANSGATFTLLRDVPLSEGININGVSGSFTLDLNGHKIEAGQSDAVAIASECGFAIEDSSAGKTGQIISTNGAALLVRAGAVKITGGAFNGSNQGLGIKGGNVTLSGGAFRGGAHCIFNEAGDLGALLKNYGAVADTHYAYYSGDSLLTDVLSGNELRGGDDSSVTVKPCDHACQSAYAHIAGSTAHSQTCPACGDAKAAEKCGYDFDQGNVGTCQNCGSKITVSVSDIEGLVYDGSEKQPTVAVTVGDTTLKDGDDYTVTYLNNTNAGDAASVKVASAKFDGSYEKTFNIAKAPLTITANSQTIAYGAPIAEGISQVTADALCSGDTLEGITLIASSDQVAAENKTITPSVAVIKNSNGEDASGNYAIEYKTGALTIMKSKPTIKVNDENAFHPDKAYDGQAVANPTADHYIITGAEFADVSFLWMDEDGNPLGDGVRPVHAGIYYVKARIEETANTEAVEADRTIRASISKAPLTIADATVQSKTYDADNAATITGVTFLGLANGETLEIGRDYTATGAFADGNAGENKDVTGSVTLLDSGKAKNYALSDDSFTAAGTIEAVSVSTATVTLSKDGFAYDGSEQKPDVTVELGGDTLTEGTDYTVSYSGSCKEAGSYTVTVTGQGNYAGTARKDFTIHANEAGIELQTDKSAYTYGENIVFTFTVKPSGNAAGNSRVKSRAAAKSNTIDFYCGDAKLNDTEITVTENTEQTFTYQTGGKGVPSGERTITAVYGGSGNLNSAEGAVTVTLNPKPLTAAVAGGSDSAAKAYDGTADFQNVALTLDGLVNENDAVVATADGTADSEDAGDQKAFTASSVALSGADQGYYTLTSGNVSGSVKIRKADPTVSVKAENKAGQSGSGTGVYGDTFVLTATVTGVNGEKPDGAVTITDNGKEVVSNAPVTDGLASFTWGGAEGPEPGTHRITAEFTPAASESGRNYNSGGSGEATLEVSKARQAELFIAEVTGKKYLDPDFTLTASGGSGDGALTWSVPADNGVLSLSGDGRAAIIGAGKVTVTVTKAADSRYESATATREIVIGKAPALQIAWPTASALTYGQRLSESALAGGSTEYGAFAWTDGGVMPTVKNNGYAVAFRPSETIEKNYEITELEQTVAITVERADMALTVKAAVSGDAGDRTATLSVLASGVSGGAVPSGAVELTDITDGKNERLETITLDADGNASYAWKNLHEREYTVKAAYSGDDNYKVKEARILFDTKKQSQSTLVPVSIGNKTYGDADFELRIQSGGNGAGAVTWQSSDPSIVSIAGSTATIHKAGAVTITVKKAGDDVYNETEASVPLTVQKANPAVSVKAENRNGQSGGSYGDAFVLTATVTGVNGEKPDGAVAFMDNGAAIQAGATATVTNGTASFAWEGAKPGTHRITAEFIPSSSGNGRNYNSGASGEATLEVSKARQAELSIDEAPGKKYLDPDFNLTASGGSGDGALTWSVPAGNGVLSLSGDGAAKIIGAGKVTVTVIKAGDSHYESATATREIAVGKAPAPRIAWPTASGIVYGQRLSDSTLAGGSTEYGAFAWTDGGVMPTVKNSGYEVTFRPSASAEKNYEITELKQKVSIAVGKADTALTVKAAASGGPGSGTTVLSVLAAGVNGGTVPSGTVKLTDITGGKNEIIAIINLDADGSASYAWENRKGQEYTVKAAYSGDDNYNVKEAQVIFDSRKQDQTALVPADIGNKTYGDADFELKIQSGGNGAGAVTWQSSDPSIVSIAGSTATIHKAGAVTITVKKAGDDAYNETETSVPLTIQKKGILVLAVDREMTAGGALPDFPVDYDGFAGADNADCCMDTKATAACQADGKTAGKFDIVLTTRAVLNAGASEKYTITEQKNGVLTVLEKKYAAAIKEGGAGASGSGSYPGGAVVAIDAGAKDGFQFSGWSGDVEFTDKSSAQTTFIMPERDVEITAGWRKTGNESGGNQGGDDGDGSGGGGSDSPGGNGGDDNSGGTGSGGDDNSGGTGGNGGSGNSTGSDGTGGSTGNGGDDSSDSNGSGGSGGTGSGGSGGSGGTGNGGSGGTGSGGTSSNGGTGSGSNGSGGGNGGAGNTGSGGSGNSSGAAGSSGKPFIKDGTGREGWDAIQAEAEKAAASPEGGTVAVDMNGAVAVPGSVLAGVKGKDVTITFDMGGGILWSVSGKDISAETVSDTDFSVKADANAVPKEIVEDKAGGLPHLELSLAHEGAFGFTATLTVRIGSKDGNSIFIGGGEPQSCAGMYANLFYYNPQMRRLEFICTRLVGEDGAVSLPFTHASGYTVIFSAYPMGGADAPAGPAGSQDGTEPGNPQDGTQPREPAENAQARVKSVTLSKTMYTYSGKAKKPSVTAVDTDGREISKKYYAVSYKNNKKVGTATATVTFKNGYSGTVKKTFTIRPANTSIKKLTAASGGFTAKWTKKTAQVSGYQIQYSTNAGFQGSGTHSVFAKKATVTKRAVKKLNAGKVYYVRIRTYKTVKTGGKNVNIYSAWSKAARVRTLPAPEQKAAASGRDRAFLMVKKEDGERKKA